MKAKITKGYVEFDKAVMVIETNDLESAKEILDSLKGCDVDVVIKKHSGKRSINANNYMWTLCKEISEAMSLTGESVTDVDVYKEAIRNVGLSQDFEMEMKAFKTMSVGWQANGIGWFADFIDFGQVDGYILARFYYGSSTYNTKRMSILIDYIVQEAKQLGIETMTPQEIQLLKESWNSNGKK